jgi:hypothetical protein
MFRIKNVKNIVTIKFIVDCLSDLRRILMSLKITRATIKNPKDLKIAGKPSGENILVIKKVKIVKPSNIRPLLSLKSLCLNSIKNERPKITNRRF